MSLPDDLRQQIETEFDSLKGWAELDRVLEIAKLVLEEKPLRCCEIGVFHGRQLIPIALTLKYLGAGQIVGIDPWFCEPCMEGENEANREWWAKVDLDEIYEEFAANVFRLGLANIVTTVRARSQDVYWMMSDLGAISIDGNHSEVVSCRDVELYLPRVKTGGLIFFDDTTWESTQKAVGMVSAQCDIVKAFANHIIFRKR
jgi:hypothetical protein